MTRSDNLMNHPAQRYNTMSPIRTVITTIPEQSFNMVAELDNDTAPSLILEPPSEFGADTVVGRPNTRTTCRRVAGQARELYIPFGSAETTKAKSNTFDRTRISDHRHRKLEDDERRSLKTQRKIACFAKQKSRISRFTPTRVCLRNWRPCEGEDRDLREDRQTLNTGTTSVLSSHGGLVREVITSENSIALVQIASRMPKSKDPEAVKPKKVFGALTQRGVAEYSRTAAANIPTEAERKLHRLVQRKLRAWT